MAPAATSKGESAALLTPTVRSPPMGIDHHHQRQQLARQLSRRSSNYSIHTPRSPFEAGFPMVFTSPVPSPRPHRLSFAYAGHEHLRELHVFSTLLMSVVGAGMLSVPYTFVLLPTWNAVLGIIIVGVAMAITATALLRAHVQLAEEEESLVHIGAGKRFSSFQSIAIVAGGETFGYIVSVVTAIGIYGGCVGCIRIVRDIGPFMISLVYTSSNADSVADAADYLMWASFLLVVFPLCLLHNLSGLRVSSYSGFAFSLYLVAVIIYRSFVAQVDPNAEAEAAPSLVESLILATTGSGNDNTNAIDSLVDAMTGSASADLIDPVITGTDGIGSEASNPTAAAALAPTIILGSPFSRYTQALSIYNYAFMMHLNLIPLFIQLRGSFAEPLETSRRKMTQSIAGVSSICVVLYAAFGIFASKLYGNTIRGNILLNMESDAVMDVPLVAVYLTVVLSFPLLFHPLRGVIEELIFTTSLNEIPFSTRLGSTSILLLSQLLVAIGVPGIEVVFALTGASSCLMICFVFPVVLYTRLYPWKRAPGGRLWICMLWLIVLFFTVIGSAATWYLLLGTPR